MNDMLRRRIQDVVATRVSAALREELLALLRRPGYPLHPEGACRAGGLALEVQAAVAGRAAGAGGPSGPRGVDVVLVAAAVELKMVAMYVFDGIADDVEGGTAAGARRGEELALATALLTAAIAVAGEAAAPAPDAAGALRHFCAAFGESCAGQFLDARLQGCGRAGLDEALRATRLKSGSLGRLAAGFAARVAGAGSTATAAFDRLGEDLFTVLQLVDDVRDACTGPASDLAQGKATLPVVFFRGRTPDPIRPADGMLSQEVRSQYESSGASLYAGILAHAYMSRAGDDLLRLAQQGYAVRGLVRFLESIDSDAGDILGVARGALVA